MSLFLDAAIAWNSLLNTSYRITIGHKNKMSVIRLVFRPGDFDHLSGIHYSSDVDYGLHRREYRGDRLLPALLSGKLDALLIEKSQNWSKIVGRLQAITDLSTILNTDFLIYKFTPNRLPFHSEIRATYCIYNAAQNKGVFLFADQADQVVYCKSIFPESDQDYRANQTRWTVLKKERITQDAIEVLFTHPSFHSSQNEQSKLISV